MKLIMFKGISKTGKTTCSKKIIAELCKRGFSVGSVKDIHFDKFTMETEGTDTDTHKKNGADPVTARGLSETNIMFKESRNIDDILSAYDQDWVVLEGNSGANCPNIVTGKTPEDLDVKIDELTVAISGIIAKDIDEYNGLPVFNVLEEPEKLIDFIMEITPERMPNYDLKQCSKCGEAGCRGLLADMLKGKRKRTGCLLERENVKLFINGKEAVMVDSTKDTIEDSFKDFVKQLDGYKKGSEVIIKFK